MIVHLTSEVAPFYKRGGLGDVVGALPKYLSAKEENVVISFFYEGRMKDNDIVLKGSFYIGIQNIQYEIIYYYKEQANVKYYFLNLSDPLLLSDLEAGESDSVIEDGESPYRNNSSFIIYLYFAKGALQLIENLRLFPHYIFFHDWHVCGCFAFPKVLNAFKAVNNCATILMIHNYEFQGEMLPDAFHWLDKEISSTFMPIFDQYGSASLLALGLQNADYVATVSTSYANELLAGMVPHFGLRFLNSIKKKKIYSLPNGIDRSVWSPQKSAFVTHRYDINTATEFKKKAKEEIEKKAGFLNTSEPIVLMMARLTEQKGINIIIDLWGAEDKVMKDVELLLNQGIRLIICGRPGGGINGIIHKRISRAQELFPQRFKYIPDYKEETAHQLLAAADAILCPSAYEPCGLVQIYGMAFGTVPVVRPVGGLRDTVIANGDHPETSTGFYISENSNESLLKAIGEMVHIYKDHPESWDQMSKRCMQQDYSWEKVLDNYYKLFEEIKEDSQLQAKI